MTSKLIPLSLVAAAALATAPAAPAHAPELKRYPYLTDVVRSNATVNWGTDRSASGGRVRYGRVGSGSCTSFGTTATRTSISVNGVAQYAWTAKLTGLVPGAEYCYRVELGSSPALDLLGADASPRFRAQLAAESSQPYSFAVIGDWGATGLTNAGPDNRQADVLARLGASGVRFALGTGDIAYSGGTQTNYGDLVQTGNNISTVFAPQFWKRIGSSIPYFTPVGNHGFNQTFLKVWPQDVAASTSGGRYLMETYCCVNGTAPKSYPSAWFAFDAGNARFYVLEAAWDNANDGEADEYLNDFDAHWAPNGPQYKWLEADLASHPSQLKFAFFHYPMYSSNATEASDLWLRGPDSLEGLLSRHGVDLGFSGHAHNYTRNDKPNAGSLVTYVTGGGGARLQPATRCGPPVAYAIGWSYTTGGSSCGAAAPRPTATDEVFHFLKVSVDGAWVTVAPIDSQGRAFDVQSYDFSPQGSPSPPSGLEATAVGPGRVDLAWTAASDDQGVTGYEVHRDGMPLSTTGATSYSDQTVAAGTTYGYRVRARDAHGNVSNWSNADTVTTPSGPPALELALVRQATGATPTAGTRLAVPISSTAGDALVAAVAVQAGSTTTVTSVSDTAGNAWNQGPVGFLQGSNTRIELWFATGAAPVSSVRVDLSAADLASANVSEWSGVRPAGALDLFSGRGNTSSTSASTPTILTTNAGDLLVGAINYPRAANSTLATAGFTRLHDFEVSTVQGRASYRIVSSIDSYSTAWTLSAASTSGAAILALEGAP